MFQNVNKKLFRGLSLAIVLAMLIAPLALADNVQGDDLEAGGNTTKSPGQSGTATFRLVSNGSDGCNVDADHSATATVVSDQSWLTINSPGSVNFTGCGDPNSQTIGYAVSSSAPIGGVAEVSVTGVTGGMSGNNGWNLNPSKFTVTITAPSDTTPPVITPNVSGTLGNSGWYTSDVTVSWSVVDNESAISSSSGCDSTTINTDTAGTTLTCTATSAGGTSSESVTIKRDATLPTLSPSVSPNPVVLNGSATASANADDATSPGSGLYSSSCDAVDTSSVGLHTVICYAEDNAGNTNTASASYSVNYDFAGFYAPIDMNVVNSAKAGQAIPIKWRLTDANGVGVSDPGSFMNVTSSNSGACGGTSDAIEEYAAGSSGLQYLGDGYWQFNWKTPKSYAGQCRTMSLNLSDGVSTRTASFLFK